MPSAEEDEALARALQEQYQREYARSRRSIRDPPAIRVAAAAPGSTESDVELARRLEQEMKDEDMARRLEQDEVHRRRRSTHVARQAKTNRTPTGAPMSAGDSPSHGHSSAPNPAPTAPGETEIMAGASRHQSKVGHSASSHSRTELPVSSHRQSRSKSPHPSSRTGQARSSSPRVRSSHVRSSSFHAHRNPSNAPPGEAAALSNSSHHRARTVNATSSYEHPETSHSSHDHTHSKSLHHSSHHGQGSSSIPTNRSSHVRSSSSHARHHPPVIASGEAESLTITSQHHARTLNAASSTPHLETSHSSHGQSKSLHNSTHNGQGSSSPANRSSHGRSSTPHSHHKRTDAHLASADDLVVPARLERQEQPSSESDIELAKRIAQEESDAALARQLAEQDSARRRAEANRTNALNRRPKRSTCRRIFSIAIPVAMIVAAIAGLVYAFAGGGVASLPGGNNEFGANDPWTGQTPSDANRWNNGGSGGLSLEVLNALQDQWDGYFGTAIDQWDNGNPDTLTLSTSQVGYDLACDPIQGKLKVCNGDYGDTKWKGINQVLLSNGYIISSVAKMNEFYLADADDDQRQYTMCHEIGHGFGLPHTDENFYNKDLGNCMDYTSNPAVNKQPDQSNFDFLFKLYGAVSRRSLVSSKLAGMTALPDDLLPRYSVALSELETRDSPSPSWTVLHKNTYGEAYSVDLGNSYVLQVHMLLAVD